MAIDRLQLGPPGRLRLLYLGLAAMTLAWWLPGHSPPWVTYQQQCLAALGAGFVCLSAAAGGRESIRWPWLALLVGLYGIVPLVQRACGQLAFVSDAVLPALYLWALAVCMTAGAALVRQHPGRWLDALMAFLVVASMVSVAIALTQWLHSAQNIFIVELPPGGRPYANLAQPNHLATLIVIGIVGLLRSYELRKLGGPVVAWATAYLGWGLVMAQSRTAYLALLVLALWWLAMRRRAGLRIAPAAVAAAAAVFAIGLAAWEPINRALLLSTDSLVSRLQPGTRGMHWQVLLDAVGQAPWRGYGWLQVTSAQAATALSHPPTHEMLQDSHNVVLDLAIWMGLPLAVPLVAATAGWLVWQGRRCRSPDAWVLLAAVGAMLTHALLEYPLDYLYFLLPLGLMMGSIEALSAPADARSHPRWTLAWPSAGLTIMLMCIGHECWQLEASAQRLRFATLGLGNVRMTDLQPVDVVVLDAPREYERFWLTPIRTDLSSSQLERLRAVALRNAYAPTLLRYARAAAVNGQGDEARRTLALLCSFHPATTCRDSRRAWAADQQAVAPLRAIDFPATP